MIISINGDHGSGKSTIAKRLAQSLEFDFYSTGEIFRQMAKDRGITLVELLKIGEADSSIDNEVDDRTVKLAQEKDDFIIDSRLAWHFIPESVKIFLKVSEEEAARRMLGHLKKENSKERANEDKNINSIEDIAESNRKRKQSDIKRYREYYGVDIWDEKNYDFVLDTTNLSIDEVFEKTRDFVGSKL